MAETRRSDENYPGLNNAVDSAFYMLEDIIMHTDNNAEREAATEALHDVENLEDDVAQYDDFHPVNMVEEQNDDSGNSSNNSATNGDTSQQDVNSSIINTECITMYYETFRTIS
ncbi:unnamed protein product [Didymodactylos carnosus]|uniref:Uncharacterized protein n=1 Tax=Didymodactylos carnosus TaxID=1234261 RepID=A0A815YHU7_9BILA|nr:unnamed protein product [Didymodactylos carnosus]CAF4434334.1 unnamed protein product [Didymodactylos carnosus]